MATITHTLTLEVPYTCGQCGDACGYLYRHDGEELCLGCELDFEEWKDRLISEYEALEAAAEWGISPTHAEPEYFLDNSCPVTDTVWSEVAADVFRKGGDLLGDVPKERLVAVALECRKVGVACRPVGLDTVALTPALVAA